MQTDESLIQEWLAECRTPSTREVYGIHIKTFQAWYKKPLNEFLELSDKDRRHAALLFQNAMIEKGAKANTVNAMITALASFCNQNTKPLFLRGKRLHVEIDLDSHTFTNGDLQAMFNIGDTQQKAILATFTSLGWECSAILGLRRAYINSLIEKAREDKQEYAFFQNQRQKTGALRLGVLNPLALEWLARWFREWNGESLFQIKTKEGINDMLVRLAEESQIKLTGRVHSHLIRKWTMSGLSRAGFNEWQTKYVMGKTIPKSDSTYLQTLRQEIEERYPAAFQNYLNIQHSPGAVTSLAKSLDAKDKEIAELKQRINQTEDKLTRIERLLEELKKEP